MTGYIHELAGLDEEFRARTFTRLCADFGADLGAFDRSWPDYLGTLAHVARQAGTDIPWTEDYWIGALVAVAGTAVGVAGATGDDLGKYVRRVLAGLEEAFEVAGRAGKALATLDPVEARSSVVRGDGGPRAKGAFDAMRLVLDAYESSMKAWAMRTSGTGELTVRISKWLLVEPATPAGLEHALSPHDDGLGEAEARRSPSAGDILSALLDLRGALLATDDFSVIGPMYGRPVPPDAWALTAEGRATLAKSVGRERSGKRKGTTSSHSPLTRKPKQAVKARRS